MNLTSVTSVQRKTVSLTTAIKDFGQYFKSLNAGSKALEHDQGTKPTSEVEHGQGTKPESAVVYSAHGL